MTYPAKQQEEYNGSIGVAQSLLIIAMAVVQ
jgi:hypothetical protein